MPGTVTGDRAVHNSFDRIASIYKLVEDLSAEMDLCTTVEEIREARSQGKIAALMGMEGGHMINNSLSVLEMYARLGIRYLTLTHSVNTDWADSSNDAPRFGGLTAFGRKVVKRLNQLGIMVDHCCPVWIVEIVYKLHEYSRLRQEKGVTHLNFCGFSWGSYPDGQGRSPAAQQFFCNFRAGCGTGASSFWLFGSRKHWPVSRSL